MGALAHLTHGYNKGVLVTFTLPRTETHSALVNNERSILPTSPKQMSTLTLELDIHPDNRPAQRDIRVQTTNVLSNGHMAIARLHCPTFVKAIPNSCDSLPRGLIARDLPVVKVAYAKPSFTHRGDEASGNERDHPTFITTKIPITPKATFRQADIKVDIESSDPDTDIRDELIGVIAAIECISRNRREFCFDNAF